MSRFYGLSKEQLKEMLKDAQFAYFEMMTGKRGVSYSYTQGDGTRSVTYNKANLADLQALIDDLLAALGLGNRRRSIGFRY